VTGRPPTRPATPLALCLGGLDPSAGAGLLRDVMTLAALGVHPMAVCTAETIQNGKSCTAIQPPADPLPRLEALAPHLSGRDPWGVKLGLCALEPGVFAALAARVEELAPAARIWDPIQAPTAGVGLHSAAGLRAMARTLLETGGWVVTPNLPEALALAGGPPPGFDPAAPLSEAAASELARPFLDLGATAVWLKGGHGPGREVEDFWLTPGAAMSLGRAPRLPGERRGTGCTLASAWLGWRLLGLPGPEAAVAAARFLRERWDPPVQPGGFGRPCFAPGAP
jgi:hydroxymethylpyrimidine/phosphomethylpyrimidine kinase